MYTDHPVTDFQVAVGADGQLIDVREPDEVAVGTLPGARNIPLGDLADRVDELDRSRPVIVLCRSGGRSAEAARFLSTQGFPTVINLAGGMLAYANSK
jgi:hydroxyacylglutathione hydrolase